MAENILAVRSQVDQTLGRKSPAAIKNKVRTLVFQSAAAYAAPANGDTLGSSLIIPQGARLKGSVLCSFGTGTASSTMSLGLRDPITKVAIDATAILNAEPFATAITVNRHTGTKVINGQEYYLPQDAEVYGTIAGAAGAANQQFRFEIDYISP